MNEESYAESIKANRSKEELLNKLNNENPILNNKITELENLINQKNNELNNLRIKLNNNNNNQILNINPGEQIIAVNFVSIGHDIQKPIACKNTDIISRLEEKVYNEYPEYKEKNTYLTVNGKMIKRFKSVEQNEIKDGNSIIVNIYEDEQ